MLNKIILATIYRETASSPDAMQADIFENPSTYKGWLYPIRYLLSLRYLKLKQTIVSEFRENKTYPISPEDYTQRLIHHLNPSDKGSGNTNTEKKAVSKNPLLSLLFKAKFIYPIIAIALVTTAIHASKWKQQQRIENVIANYLPYYSDLLHRKLLLKHNDAGESLIAKLDISIKATSEKILNELPEKNGIRALMAEQLTKLEDSESDSESIMLGFKAVNTLFDKHKQPYYLSPKSFTLPCSSLIDAPIEQMMMLKELESLLSNNNPERCRTTMMTSYKVDDRTQLFYKDKHQEKSDEIELPLFHVRRIDKVPAVDGALGLTFKDRGIGSIILVDRIKNFTRESILPALTFQGRNYIIPYWMQGHYEIEEAITKGYKKDINQIYSDKAEQTEVKTLIKQLIKDKSRMQNSKMEQTMQRTISNNDNNLFGNGLDAISVLLGKDQQKNEKKKEFPRMRFDSKSARSLRKLDHALYSSIEYHEAYHQIDKKEWPQPNWIKSTFKGQLNDNALEHTMEELGAYLSQLATTDQAQNIWLSKLLIFSLNPMTKGQAEYYASSIIFTALESLYLEEAIIPTYIATVDDKTRIYKQLLTMDVEEIKELSRRAYQILFHRDVPALTTNALKN